MDQNGPPKIDQYISYTLYFMGNPSKVMGRWGHIDFFGLIENHILVDFDEIFFSIFKISFLLN